MRRKVFDPIKASTERVNKIYGPDAERYCNVFISVGRKRSACADQGAESGPAGSQLTAQEPLYSFIP